MELFSLISFLFLAFILGVAHAFEADHVAAVTALIGKTRSVRQSAFSGIVWGLGHTSSLLLVGVVLLALKLSIPEHIQLSLEAMVGVVLIMLGISTMWKARKDTLHMHTHAHDGEEHAHVHSHKETRSHTHIHASFSVGLLHGFAGSSALVLLAVASSQTLFSGTIFIIFFGLGSVLGMMCLGAFVGYILHKAHQFSWLTRYVQASAGLLSTFVGVLLLQEMFLLI